MLTLDYIKDEPLEEWNTYDSIERELVNLPWLTKRTARHEYFMSDKKIEYSYGNDINYKSEALTPWVKKIMEKLNKNYKTKFNACFLNKYDDEHQHLGWHADDFDGMDQSQPIAVISFGAEREIWTKPQGYKGEIPSKWRYLLREGSLFMMPVGFQDTHYHRIPKHSCPCGWRISLTYRSFKD